nr:hypothetical protein [Tanacetum cinerariifolium]
MIPEPGDTNRDVPVNETFHVQTDDELTEKELKQIEADDQAIQTILLSLPEDIYASVDKWSQYVTIVHQTKDLHTADYTQLYDFLKYNQKEVDELKAERLAKIQDPLALMANSNNPYAFLAPPQDQPSFNQNYMQQLMPNPEDITDPTTVMNMALALMAKAFKLNYSTPINNNQRISSNPRNRQIAQPSINMGQDRQMQMVGGYGENQFRQYAGQNVGNLNGYNAIQNVRNQVAQNPRVQNVENQNGQIGVPRNANLNGNAGQDGNQIRCYNCRGVGYFARNCMTQLLIAQKEEAGIQLQDEEFDLMDAASDLDEIEEVNANCILMANLQQASTSAKFVGDFKSLAKEADESLAKHKALELDIERLLRAVDNKCGTSANTKFKKQSIMENLPKVDETHALSKPVTSNSDPTPQELKAVKNDKVIAPEMFRINPFKTSREEKHVPNNVRASAKTKPITVSQPPVITQKDMNSDSNGLSSTGIDNTKTRRPQPRSNTMNDRIPSASKNSRSKNKGAEVEEHHRNLFLSKNTKHMSSACNNIKLDSHNVISKVVCAMCKQCLISVNHDVCLRSYVKGETFCGKKQKANVSIKEKQKKHQPKGKKPKKVGFIERLATPKPRKPRFLLRWSPTGRLFDQKGKIVDSSESESQSNCSNGDNACTSNTLEPKIKRFLNSTSLLGMLSRFVYGVSARVVLST